MPSSLLVLKRAFTGAQVRKYSEILLELNVGNSDLHVWDILKKNWQCLKKTTPSVMRFDVPKFM